MTDVSAAPAILISRMLPEEAVRLARSRARVDIHDGEAPLRKPELMARLKGRQGLICLITDQIDDELLAGCPDLRVVANVAVGFNNIDVEAATRRGVVVTNTPDVLTETTADFAWALLMATARRVVEGDQLRAPRPVQAMGVHASCSAATCTARPSGSSASAASAARWRGGRSASACACCTRMPRPPMPRPSAASTPRAPTCPRSSGNPISSRSTRPSLPETRHLIGADALKAMKKTAYLINASRGPVVDEAALVEALRDGWIAGAGLDVFEEEPTVHPGLLGLTNVVLAPHIASASHDTRLKMATLAVDNCLAVLEGKMPPTPVNPEVLLARGK